MARLRHPNCVLFMGVCPSPAAIVTGGSVCVAGTSMAGWSLQGGQHDFNPVRKYAYTSARWCQVLSTVSPSAL